MQTCMCEGGRQDVEDHHGNDARYKAMIPYSFITVQIILSSLVADVVFCGMQ